MHARSWLLLLAAASAGGCDEVRTVDAARATVPDVPLVPAAPRDAGPARDAQPDAAEAPDDATTDAIPTSDAEEAGS